MPFEWMGISVAVSAFAQKYLEHRASNIADAKLRLPGRSALLNHANEIFVDRFGKQLARVIQLPTLTQENYHRALERFLCQGFAQRKLEDTLDGWSDLDWKALSDFWSELTDAEGVHIISLPVEFDWPLVAAEYNAAVRKYMLADADARHAVAAGAAVHQVELTEQIKAHLEQMAQPGGPLNLDRYAEAIEANYAKLKLAVLDPSGTYSDRRVRLMSIYVPQSVRQAIPPRDITRDYLLQMRDLSLRTQKVLAQSRTISDSDRKMLEKEARKLQSYQLSVPKALRERQNNYLQQQKIPLSEIVDADRYRRIVLLGDPGLGKSSLLRMMALRWTRNRSRPLALLIELRQAMTGERYEGFLDYLETGDAPECCLAQAALHQHMKDNETLVMFDGLDEVANEHRHDAVSAIIKFGQEYSKARIIVTTRIYGYHPGSIHPERFQDAKFEQFTLQDLDADHIEQLIAA